MPTKTTSPGKPVTQKQIAEKVGVSQQLVALALTGSTRVAPETRRKIQLTAKRLGYNPETNRHARSMAASRHGKELRSNILAVIFEAVPEAPAAGVPYFVPMVDGIETEASLLELDLFLVPDRPTGLPWLIRERWVDGVILLGVPGHGDELRKTGLPVVSTGPDWQGANLLFPDNETGMRLMAQHLLSLGHRRFGYIGPRNWPTANERLEVFHSEVTRGGGFLGAGCVEMTADVPHPHAGEEACRRLLARFESGNLPITAIACHNDPLAVGALTALKNAGLRVPTDISLTGFDDVSRDYRVRPALTSVGYDRHAMGRRAVQLLCELRQENGHAATRKETFPVQLAIRQSTAVPKKS